MTTDDTTPSVDQQGAASPAPAPVPANETPKSGNAEAAKYRNQLRDVTTERDALAASLTAARKTMVEGIAGKSLEKPESLWASDTKLEDLLDEDGNVDSEKVTAAATKAADELGLRKAPTGPIVRRAGNEPSVGAGLTGGGFAGAFAPR
ncbi:hypothetical protein [Curtobacterium aetherium]|uniref:Uncharacterized protein n=1 Tax=Curtobacterium aetherium TaxID=2841594 RepID=A0ACD1E588_9MICO|nr:hypothetical protein [Curtobacterium sp. L6-1]QWS34044.1 hypothetical protein KM842_02240 [Curtobacterium sp. L6-1]